MKNKSFLLLLSLFLSLFTGSFLKIQETSKNVHLNPLQRPLINLPKIYEHYRSFHKNFTDRDISYTIETKFYLEKLMNFNSYSIRYEIRIVKNLEDIYQVNAIRNVPLNTKIHLIYEIPWKFERFINEKFMTNLQNSPIGHNSLLERYIFDSFQEQEEKINQDDSIYSFLVSKASFKLLTDHLFPKTFQETLNERRILNITLYEETLRIEASENTTYNVLFMREGANIILTGPNKNWDVYILLPSLNKTNEVFINPTSEKNNVSLYLVVPPEPDKELYYHITNYIQSPKKLAGFNIGFLHIKTLALANIKFTVQSKTITHLTSLPSFINLIYDLTKDSYVFIKDLPENFMVVNASVHLENNKVLSEQKSLFITGNQAKIVVKDLKESWYINGCFNTSSHQFYNIPNQWFQNEMLNYHIPLIISFGCSIYTKEIQEVNLTTKYCKGSNLNPKDYTLYLNIINGNLEYNEDIAPIQSIRITDKLQINNGSFIKISDGFRMDVYGNFSRQSDISYLDWFNSFKTLTIYSFNCLGNSSISLFNITSLTQHIYYYNNLKTQIPKFYLGNSLNYTSVYTNISKETFLLDQLNVKLTPISLNISDVLIIESTANHINLTVEINDLSSTIDPVYLINQVIPTLFILKQGNYKIMLDKERSIGYLSLKVLDPKKEIYENEDYKETYCFYPRYQCNDQHSVDSNIYRKVCLNHYFKDSCMTNQSIRIQSIDPFQCYNITENFMIDNQINITRKSINYFYQSYPLTSFIIYHVLLVLIISIYPYIKTFDIIHFPLTTLGLLQSVWPDTNEWDTLSRHFISLSEYLTSMSTGWICQDYFLQQLILVIISSFLLMLIIFILRISYYFYIKKSNQENNLNDEKWMNINHLIRQIVLSIIIFLLPLIVFISKITYNLIYMWLSFTLLLLLVFFIGEKIISVKRAVQNDNKQKILYSSIFRLSWYFSISLFIISSFLSNTIFGKIEFPISMQSIYYLFIYIESFHILLKVLNSFEKQVSCYKFSIITLWGLMLISITISLIGFILFFSFKFNSIHTWIYLSIWFGFYILFRVIQIIIHLIINRKKITCSNHRNYQIKSDGGDYDSINQSETTPIITIPEYKERTPDNKTRNSSGDGT